MPSSTLSGVSLVKLTLALLMAALPSGPLAFGQTSAPAPATGAAPTSGSRPDVRRALREFDRFLDHHPLLEDDLRLDPQLTADRAFLEKNPELRDFLHANPNVAAGLKTYPRYFLNRALLRQASAPLSFAELAPFKALFQAQPELEQALKESPESIRDPLFLAAHPALHEVLLGHPALAQVFLSPPGPQKPP